MSNIIKLSATDVVELRHIISKTDKNDDPIMVYSYEDLGFTVRPDLHEAIQRGDVASLKLEKSSYVRANADGIDETVACWQVKGYKTYTQLKGVLRNEAELRAIEKEFNLTDVLATIS